jgi:hypothetical protein
VKNKGKDGENIAEGTARPAVNGGCRRGYDDAATYALLMGRTEKKAAKRSRRAAKKSPYKTKKPPSNAAAVFEP